jgi:hypothetical protein
VRTSLDAKKTLENKIRKDAPLPPQFEATQQKQFLRDAMESLKNTLVFHKEPQNPKQCEPQPEDQVNTFLKCCIKILNDPHVSKRLTELLMRWIARLEDDYIHISAPLPKKHVRHVKKKRKTNKELKMAMELRGYEMQEVMLNLGSYVNILPKKTWE